MSGGAIGSSKGAGARVPQEIIQHISLSCVTQESLFVENTYNVRKAHKNSIEVHAIVNSTFMPVCTPSLSNGYYV